ncbi:hypothetical protein EU527_00380 [Candidatus Thorarchaeota archaeon]|nr:MAG: hypothetical protein EU527_00380 [Candidatus Thorarchaeota archaeon]
MVKCNVCFLAATICTSSDEYLTKWFVYVSGENVELAKAEVYSLLRSVLSDVRIDWIERLAIIESAISISEFILDRAALTQRAGRIIYEADSVESLRAKESSNIWRCLMTSRDTFSIKILCVGTNIESEKRNQLERDLGAHIKTAAGANVDLRNAAKQILVILTDENVLICLSNDSKLRIDLKDREPGKKPFFHPSMMNSKLARVMCNLVQVKKGEVMLDPFCGGGGILCEASYLGAFVIGLDLNWKLLTGARMNLREIGHKYSIIQADAQHIPISSVDCIVTDPPYGRSSSTRGGQSIKLIETMLERIDSIIDSREERVCICGDAEMNLPRLVEDCGLLIGLDFKMRVHSGLVREIVTIKV